jgi:hypothetical protein
MVSVKSILVVVMMLAAQSLHAAPILEYRFKLERQDAHRVITKDIYCGIHADKVVLKHGENGMEISKETSVSLNDLSRNTIQQHLQSASRTELITTSNIGRLFFSSLVGNMVDESGLEKSITLIETVPDSISNRESNETLILSRFGETACQMAGLTTGFVF